MSMTPTPIDEADFDAFLTEALAYGDSQEYRDKMSSLKAHCFECLVQHEMAMEDLREKV